MKSRKLFFFAIAITLYQLIIGYPIAIWTRNKYNFEASLTDSLSVFAVLLIVVIGLSLALSFVMPSKARRLLTPVLVVVNVGIFVQQNFLTWNYGILDGHTLDFSNHNTIGLVDLALWITVFVLGLFASKVIRKLSANILIAVGSMSLVLTGINIVKFGKPESTYTIDERSKFDFSKNKNVIVFLFDAYQMDVLLELLDKHPNLENSFEGFTLYENHSAVFAKTYPTIPLFLTGKRYQKEKPILEFFDEVYDGSLIQEMQNSGWNVGLYPHLSRFPSLVNAIDIKPETMDNIVGGTPALRKINTYLQALDLSLFRAIPHQLKPVIYNDGEFVAKKKLGSLIKFQDNSLNDQSVFTYKTDTGHHALGFQENIRDHGVANLEEPAFRFYHMMMPHSPLVLDGDLNVVKHTGSFEAFQNYSLAGLKLMASYLDSLKTANAYDNAAIVIVSDHGMGHVNSKQYDPKSKTYIDLEKFGRPRAAAKSILLVKEPNSRFPLTRSHKPVSGIDVAPTLAALAGFSAEGYEGQNVAAIVDTDNRSRIFNYYTFSTWDSKYLDDFEVFEIDGDVRQDNSWNRQGMFKESIKIENKPTYNLGEILSYGTDVKSDSDFVNAFITDTEYENKPNYIEAKDGQINLDIKLKSKPEKNQFLLLQFEIYSGPTVNREITINGYSFTELIKPRRRRLNRGFFISPEMHKGKKNFQLSFAPANGSQPAALRLSSIKISTLQLPLLAENQLYPFDASAKQFFPQGIDKPNKNGAVILQPTSSLAFSANQNLCRQNLLKLTAKIGSQTNERASLQVALNGKKLALQDKNDDSGNVNFWFRCEETFTRKSNVLEFSLVPNISEKQPQKIEELNFILRSFGFTEAPN